MVKLSVALTALMVLAAVGNAQTPAWKFQWKTGQVLTYKVEHTTSATEVLEGKKSVTTSKLNNSKRWQVLEVDAAGMATLQLSLTALRIQNTTPTGEVMLFDSANLEGSNPQMREQLTKYVDEPLVTLKVNSRGKVIEVKECKFGSAGRFESEPPFLVILPEQAGQKEWERNYAITLEPPHGTGEKFEAVQKYAIQAANEKAARIAWTTTLKSPPETANDQIPLLQMQPEGQVIFNHQTGMVEIGRLTVDKEVKGHQGEGSSYRFQSVYTEEYAANK